MATAEERTQSLSKTGIAALAIGLDLLILAGTALAWYAGYVGWAESTLTNYGFVVLSASVMMVALLNRSDDYDPSRLVHLSHQLSRVVRVVVGAACFLIVIAFACKVAESFSRVWTFSWIVTAVVGLGAARIFWARYVGGLQARGAFRERIAIVGITDQSVRLVWALQEGDSAPYKLVGAFDDRDPQRRSSLQEDIPTGSLRDLEAATRRGEVDHVVIALPSSAESRIRDMVAYMRTLPVSVHLVPGLASFLRPGVQMSYLMGVPTLDLMARPMEERDVLLKTVCDRLIALAAIIVLSPVMLAIAIAIKLDSPGPVLFRQNRYGFNNSIFELKKFRSMTVAACTDSSVAQATQGDARVTRLGRFLRRTSLDELPQLFNVLDGTMSLVGPRPHAMQHHRIYEESISDYSFRHKVKPGITGWAQVNGLRGETETNEKMAARVMYDAYYVDHWSLWLDFKIMARTALVLFFQKTAY